MNDYNSLTKKLIEDGIIKDTTSDTSELNIFSIGLNNEASSASYVEAPIESIKQEPIISKRLNKSDYEMVSESLDDSVSNNSFKLIKRFLSIKQNLASKGALNHLENFLFAFFPKLYKAKLARDAMAKLKELNIDTQKLLDKTIPYGEGEIRYQNLVKFLNFANEIQTNIKKKID
ncbi:MAG: hypothetical protein IJW73_05745 [Candidatus Gastranaerophilales bacterium]|nr:hypothetical protein [Candidatus Gastranaerophilales bacterium]